MSMTKKWKKSVGKRKTFAVLLTNLSKAFDCLPHDLIIAKLNAVLMSSVSHPQGYFFNRKQITEINNG